jgi:CubicO group peptidase (beta-lactamase class C family)
MTVRIAGAVAIALASAAVHAASFAARPSTIDHRPSTIGHRPPPIAHRPSDAVRGADVNARAIDEIFAPWAKKDSPGCAVGVFEGGAIAYQKGYGMASLEHDAPITPETVFYAGSVSKQFTAMAAALAIRQGKLAYDDPIRTYLPELPPYADGIEVRHLVHHTSGLRDYNTLLSIAGRRDEDAWDNRVVLQMTAKQTRLNFAPGAEYLYSNTGYTLLATIVERATGTAFAAYADANIFTPLGMTSSHYHVDARRLVPRRALAYAGRGGEWTLDTPINERAGAGGLYTSIPDLQKWDENFYAARVGGPDVIAKLQTPGTLNDGTALSYAWGLQLGTYRGLPIVEHGGSLGGYRAHILRFPSRHASVALLCNLASIAPSGLARRVADVAMRGTFTQPVPAANAAGGGRGTGAGAATAASAAFPIADFVGTYEATEVDGAFVISGRDGRLWLKRETDPEPIEMVASGAPDRFRARGLTIRFERDAAKRVTALSVDAGRVRDIRFAKRRDEPTGGAQRHEDTKERLFSFL